MEEERKIVKLTLEHVDKGVSVYKPHGLLLQLMKIEKKNLLKSVHFKKTVHDLHFFKIVVVFNTTSADIKTNSADYHNFERNEDSATVFLKCKDFTGFFFQI